MSESIVACEAPWLAERAALEPHAWALRGENTTFTELAAESDHLAGVLLGLGVRAGSRVAVLMTPGRRLMALLYAVQRIGAVLVPLGIRLTAHEIGLQLERIESALLVNDTVNEKLAEAAVSEVVPSRELRVVRSADLDRFARSAKPLPREIDPRAVLTILFTSGTASRPKAVILTNANHYASACCVASHLNVTSRDCWLCALPLSHVGGLSILLRGVIAGFAVTLYDSFDAERVSACIEAGLTNIVSLVPTMLARVLDASTGLAPAVLRAVVCGGAALAPALVQRAVRAGYPVIATYGLTETASQVTATRLGSTEPGDPTSGRPLPGVELRIENPDHQNVGEILVRAPQVMAGYWGDAAATASALMDGWLHTGDAGRLEHDGSLLVVDRRADLIVSGGENISPAEVEAVLLEHPLVADAGVYPQADDLWGQIVAAAVVGKQGERLDPSSLDEWCRKRLARFKVPRRFALVAKLPRTASGKLRRNELMEAMRKR